VYQQGRGLRSGALSLRFVRNARQSKYRIAVVVSRKVSKSAVVRNRLRRQIFEAVRREGARINGPIDLVFSVQNEDVAKDNESLRRMVTGLMTQAGVFKDGQTPTDHGIVEGKET
jgi:ribonuclease P protein component